MPKLRLKTNYKVKSWARTSTIWRWAILIFKIEYQWIYPLFSSLIFTKILNILVYRHLHENCRKLNFTLKWQLLKFLFFLTEIDYTFFFKVAENRKNTLFWFFILSHKFFCLSLGKGIATQNIAMKSRSLKQCLRLLGSLITKIQFFS